MKVEEIIALRKSFGVSQERFAHMIGSTVVSVCRWESGKVKPSRLYIKELQNLRRSGGSYVCRREESENA